MASSPPHPIAAPLYDRGSPTESDRGALSRALEQSEERFQLLVRRVSVGVFRASRDGRLLEVNPALVRMLGYACDSELRALDLHRDVFADAVENERLRARLARRPIERLTTRWRRKDGTCIAVRLSMRELQDDGSGMVFYDGIVDDVTDRIRQQELLRRTERMACLGATLAGVAHELNNPLAAILGFAQLLMKQEVDRDARLALETIDHEASRAGRIVRDLLTLVRKRDAERRVRSSLNDIVAYIAGTRRYALETHGITCDTDLDPRLPNVVGDRTQLEQVVLNLLNNAEQAIRAVREEGGRIRIRTWADGSTAVLEVEDDGPGIPPESHDRIWDPFWTTKGTGAGTGLGLTVVRDIVVAHGGDIRVENIADLDASPGARFVVRMPGVCGPMGSGDLFVDTASRALDVLVIDPDAQSANFLRAFLSSRGHAALAADDLDYAMHLAANLTFDAVICDASFAAAGASLELFRESSGCGRARFIVTAGDPESTAKLRLPLPPQTALVMRPYDLEELRVLLED
ncbi:MAG TPA: ATP-binding protein [Gemmatimonadaceae bacterium]|nr:ATP-binding protein [Gemmatimonadaceae bacterium]